MVAQLELDEVAVTRKITTVTDVLRYLNDFFNPNTTDTVLSPQSIGFSIFTTYSPDLDVSSQYTGLEFETFEDISTQLRLLYQLYQQLHNPNH